MAFSIQGKGRGNKACSPAGRTNPEFIAFQRVRADGPRAFEGFKGSVASDPLNGLLITCAATEINPVIIRAAPRHLDRGELAEWPRERA